MTAIREIQDPQHRHLIIAGGALAPHRRIKSAPGELRLAFWIAAAVNGITFDDGDDAPQHSKRMDDALGAQQREIVSRGMVFGIFANGCTHQATDRQIKTGRAILPLVATIGNKGPDAVGGLIVTQHMCDDAIDGGVAATAQSEFRA